MLTMISLITVAVVSFIGGFMVGDRLHSRNLKTIFAETCGKCLAQAEHPTKTYCKYCKAKPFRNYFFLEEEDE